MEPEARRGGGLSDTSCGARAGPRPCPPPTAGAAQAVTEASALRRSHLLSPFPHSPLTSPRPQGPQGRTTCASIRLPLGTGDPASLGRTRSRGAEIWGFAVPGLSLVRTGRPPLWAHGRARLLQGQGPVSCLATPFCRAQPGRRQASGVSALLFLGTPREPDLLSLSFPSGSPSGGWFEIQDPAQIMPPLFFIAVLSI